MRAMVCGAAIAGLTTAWWLCRYGWDVILVERDPALRAAGYLIDFGRPGYDVIDRMNLLPQLREVAQHIPAAVFVNADGRQTARLDFSVAERLMDGKMANLMRGDLARVLHNALPDHVRRRFGTTVRSVREFMGEVQVTLSDGSEHVVDLLVGADGVRSHTRRMAFGPDELYLRPLGYHTAAFLFTDARIAAELGPQVRMLTLPGRQAGFYRLPDSRIASFLIHQSCARDLPADPVAAIREAYAGMGWVVDAALASCPPADQVFYDLVAQVKMPTLSLGNTALVGDAGMAVSLLAGQGASLAAYSGYLLARHVRDAADIPLALAGYHRDLNPVVDRQQRAGRRAANWVIPTRRWQIMVRDTVVSAAGLPGLSRLLAPLIAGADAHVPVP
ncbi:FAD-dependent monooxygenase [Kutzneria sp. NPDC051319]|uniref:FAD-dependent monooxygenase n=1 Tax=Kutzneria sp. NPDC051319 TaxID=3155047 RepID=UPI00342CAF15